MNQKNGVSGTLFWNSTSGKSFFNTSNTSQTNVTQSGKPKKKSNQSKKSASANAIERSNNEFTFSTPNKTESFEFPSSNSSSTPSFFENISGASSSFLNVSGATASTPVAESFPLNNSSSQVPSEIKNSQSPFEISSHATVFGERNQPQGRTVFNTNPISLTMNHQNNFFGANHSSPGTGGAKPRTSGSDDAMKQYDNSPIKKSSSPTNFVFSFDSTPKDIGKRRIQARRRTTPTDKNDMQQELTQWFNKLNVSSRKKENDSSSENKNYVSSSNKQSVSTESIIKPKEETGGNMLSLNNELMQLRTLVTDLNGIRPLNDMRTVSTMVESLEKTLQSVRDAFTCEICHLPQYNFFYFCPECGRLTGCFLCSYRIDRCPTCRKHFPNRKNRKPNMIPGLADAFGERLISRDDLKRQLERIDKS